MLSIGHTIFRGVSVGLQFVVPLVFGLATILSTFKRRQRRTLLETQTGLESVNQLSWQQFELLVGEIYRRRGYSVLESSGGGADGGIDLEARKEGEKFLIQCKHWRRHKVDVRTVREFLGVLYRSGAAGGAIVTTGSFTQAARTEVVGESIELIDGPGLVAMMRSKADASAAEQPPHIESATVTKCPRCGSDMAERRNSKTGQLFWG
jgi:restriction system protein